MELRALLRIGDRVRVIPVSFYCGFDKHGNPAFPATVTYVHPLGRFYVATFDNGIRESFHLMQTSAFPLCPPTDTEIRREARPPSGPKKKHKRKRQFLM